MGPILLVDDNYDFRLMTRELLQRNGFNVISVGSAAEAQAVLLKRPVSLLVTDLYMPGMSGFGLIRRIREAGMSPPPVIAITGYDFLSGPASRLAAGQLGARMVLKKPLNSEALFRAIAHALTDGGQPNERVEEDEQREA